MEDVTPITLARARPHGNRARVFFNRFELRLILDIYGRMVAAGNWRDYAMDQVDGTAVFAAYRRASEMPEYRIVKAPRLARKQGAYLILGSAGQVLKRGHSLANALKIFEAKLLKLVN